MLNLNGVWTRDWMNNIWWFGKRAKTFYIIRSHSDHVTPRKAISAQRKRDQKTQESSNKSVSKKKSLWFPIRYVVAPYNHTHALIVTLRIEIKNKKIITFLKNKKISFFWFVISKINKKTNRRAELSERARAHSTERERARGTQRETRLETEQPARSPSTQRSRVKQK